jgi:CDP-glycerol glycerophosphotransferase (TagB/SpsB family)
MQDITLLREARRHGVKTVGMPGSWDHFPKRFEPLKLDTLLVWNETVKKEGIELQGYDEKNIAITGVPHYDIFAREDLLESRKSFCKKHGFDPAKKILFFASDSRYAPNDGDIVSIMLEAIKNKQFYRDAQILVRPYPGISSEHEKFDQFNNEPLVYVDWIEPIKLFGHSGFGWYPKFEEIVYFMNCLYHADVIVNTYSSVSVEGSAFLKPIININFDGYDTKPFEKSVKRFGRQTHSRHVLDTGGAIQAENAEALINIINAFLKNPETNEDNVITLRDKMCWRVDGESSKRIADHIITCLNN